MSDVAFKRPKQKYDSYEDDPDFRMSEKLAGLVAVL
jgi:hypothetical protein